MLSVEHTYIIRTRYGILLISNGTRCFRPVHFIRSAARGSWGRREICLHNCIWLAQADSVVAWRYICHRCDSLPSSSRKGLEFFVHEKSQFPATFNPRVSTFSFSLFILRALPHPTHTLSGRGTRTPHPSIRSSCILYSRAFAHASSSRLLRPISRALFATHPPSRSLRFRLSSMVHRVFLVFFFRLSAAFHLCPFYYAIILVLLSLASRSSHSRIFYLSPARWNFLLLTHSNLLTFILPFSLSCYPASSVCLSALYSPHDALPLLYIRNVFYFYIFARELEFFLSGLPGVSLSSINLFSSGASGLPFSSCPFYFSFRFLLSPL